jgi:hypothetical protein
MDHRFLKLRAEPGALHSGRNGSGNKDGQDHNQRRWVKPCSDCPLWLSVGLMPPKKVRAIFSHPRDEQPYVARH